MANSNLTNILLEFLNKRLQCEIVLTKKLSFKEGALEFEVCVESAGESRLVGFFDSPEEAAQEIANATTNASKKQGKITVEIIPNLVEELKKLRANARLNAASIKLRD